MDRSAEDNAREFMRAFNLALEALNAREDYTKDEFEELWMIKTMADPRPGYYFDDLLNQLRAGSTHPEHCMWSLTHLLVAAVLLGRLGAKKAHGTAITSFDAFVSARQRQLAVKSAEIRTEWHAEALDHARKIAREKLPRSLSRLARDVKEAMGRKCPVESEQVRRILRERCDGESWQTLAG